MRLGHGSARCALLWSAAIVFLTIVGPLSAQGRRDPFTQAEVDEIRDTSWEPQLRLAAYVKFARARLAGLETMRSDPKTKNRAQQTHDRLDDFLLIYDELNDNIDTYVDRKNDIRKPLKSIIDADTEFEAKLRALKDAPQVAPAEAAQYQFVLSEALNTLETAAEEHRKLMDDQEYAAKHRKKSNVQPAARPE